MYIYNIVEFDFTYPELLLVFIPLSLAVASLVGVLSATLSYHVRPERLLSLLFVLALLMWVQGTLLVWDYGFLDGREIDWGAKRVNGLLDGALWIVLVSLCLARPGVFSRFSSLASKAFLLVQAAALFFVLLKAPVEAWSRPVSNEDLRFRFSSDRNVIILVLDTFQTDMFAEIITEDESYREIFDGFYYHPDAVGGYPTTYPSVPLLLTGRYYENSMPIRDFVKQAYLSESSIPRVLKENGYNVVLSTPEGYSVYRDSSVVSTPEGNRPIGFMVASNAAELIDLVLFRHLPHYLKKAVFKEGINMPFFVQRALGDKRTVHGDVLFIRDMKAGSEVSIKEKAFRFYHLRGVHIPYVLNERLEDVELKYTREGLKQYSKAKLKLTAMFIERLKDLGIYDNTLLFVLADHGDRTPDFRSPASIDDPEDMSYLSPLVLIKPFGCRGPLKVIKTPVSLGDMPKTVFSALGIKADPSGTSIFELKPGMERQRRYLTYVWEPEDYDGKYLSPMKEFVIAGMSWQRKSWSQTGRIFYSPDTVARRDMYFYGTPLVFGKSGNARAYQGYGWENYLEGSSLIKGPKASLELPVLPPEGSLIMEAFMGPSPKDGKSAVKLKVLLNGKLEAVWNIDGYGKYEAVIPPQDMSGQEKINIVFEMQPPASSSEPGSPGKEAIGLRVMSVAIHGR